MRIPLVEREGKAEELINGWGFFIVQHNRCTIETSSWIAILGGGNIMRCEPLGILLVAEGAKGGSAIV